jgi:hypothetical protein
MTHAAALQSPLLLLHGSAYLITPPCGRDAFLDKAATIDKTLKLYEGAFIIPLAIRTARKCWEM